MPTKIRLQRKGKRGRPFYHIIIADGRAPRDGKFVERIGTYNTLTKPAEIEIDFDRALYWLQSGAQPSDTVRSILSYKGVLYKNHLLTGVRKGALTEEQADTKFQEWMKTKQEKILESIKETSLSKKDQQKKRLAAEAKVNEARAKELAAKRAKEMKEMREEEAEEVAAEVTAENTEEVVAEVAAAEETVAEVAVAEETVAEVAAAEETVAEVVTVEEVVAEATPAETEEIIAEAAPESEPTAETTETKTEAEA